MLRRQTVIVDMIEHRVRGQQRQGVMGIEVADRPAAAVKINRQRAVTEPWYIRVLSVCPCRGSCSELVLSSGKGCSPTPIDSCAGSTSGTQAF